MNGRRYEDEWWACSVLSSRDVPSFDANLYGSAPSGARRASQPSQPSPIGYANLLRKLIKSFMKACPVQPAGGSRAKQFSKDNIGRLYSYAVSDDRHCAVIYQKPACAVAAASFALRCSWNTIVDHCFQSESECLSCYMVLLVTQLASPTRGQSTYLGIPQSIGPLVNVQYSI